MVAPANGPSGQLTLEPGQLNEQQLEPTDKATYTIPVRNDFNVRVTDLAAKATFTDLSQDIRVTSVEVQYPLANQKLLLPGGLAFIVVGIETRNATPGSYSLDIYDVACKLYPPDLGPFSGNQSITVSPD